MVNNKEQRKLSKEIGHYFIASLFQPIVIQNWQRSYLFQLVLPMLWFDGHGLLFCRQNRRNGRVKSRASYVVHYFFQLKQLKHRTYSKYLVDRNSFGYLDFICTVEAASLKNVAMRRHESRNCRFVVKHKRSYRDANSCPLCRSKMFFIFIDLLTFDVHLPIGRLSPDSTCTLIRSELSNAMKTKIHSIQSLIRCFSLPLSPFLSLHEVQYRS